MTEPPAAHEIAIFWDYENVPVPPWATAADACKAIADNVSKHGRIVDRRLYFDFEADKKAWTEFDAAGFDLVNTPQRNKKETLDKKLIVDMLALAWDAAARKDGCKVCVVLLTGDGDYAYALNKLKDRAVKVIVMTGKDERVATSLQSTADEVMNFERDVVRKSMNTSSTHDSVDNAKALCKVIKQELYRTNKRRCDWLLASSIGLIFRNKIGCNQTAGAAKAKFLYQEARDTAAEKKWLERGRRRLVGPNIHDIVPIPSGVAASDKVYSKEEYLRVIDHKASAASTLSAKPNYAQTRLFIKNIPRSMSIVEIVSSLEGAHGISVVRGCIKLKWPGAPFMFARLETEKIEDATKLYDLGRSSKLSLGGRLLEVGYDWDKTSYKLHLPEHFYEKRHVVQVPTTLSSAFSVDPSTLSAPHAPPPQPVYLLNAPQNTVVKQLVDYIEYSYSISIQSATILRAGEIQAIRIDFHASVDSEKFSQQVQAQPLIYGSQLLSLCLNINQHESWCEVDCYEGSSNGSYRPQTQENGALITTPIFRGQLAAGERVPADMLPGIPEKHRNGNMSPGSVTDFLWS